MIFLLLFLNTQKTQIAETVTCTPTVYLGEIKHDITQPGGERFFCTVCGKNYLRKRHLQRHMRDECIGIPPRFECELCPSKFRRKYHLVRHLNARHGIAPENAADCSPNQFHHQMKTECGKNDNNDLGAVLMNNFSVEAIMMKNSEAIAAAAAATSGERSNVGVSVSNVVAPDVHFFQKLQEKLGMFLNAEAMMKNRKIEPMNF